MDGECQMLGVHVREKFRYAGCLNIAVGQVAPQADSVGLAMVVAVHVVPVVVAAVESTPVIIVVPALKALLVVLVVASVGGGLGASPRDCGCSDGENGDKQQEYLA